MLIALQMLITPQSIRKRIRQIHPVNPLKNARRSTKKFLNVYPYYTLRILLTQYPIPTEISTKTFTKNSHGIFFCQTADALLSVLFTITATLRSYEFIQFFPEIIAFFIIYFQLNLLIKSKIHKT